MVIRIGRHSKSYCVATHFKPGFPDIAPLQFSGVLSHIIALECDEIAFCLPIAQCSVSLLAMLGAVVMSEN